MISGASPACQIRTSMSDQSWGAQLCAGTCFDIHIAQWSANGKDRFGAFANEIRWGGRCLDPSHLPERLVEMKHGDAPGPHEATTAPFLHVDRRRCVWS